MPAISGRTVFARPDTSTWLGSATATRMAALMKNASPLFTGGDALNFSVSQSLLEAGSQAHAAPEFLAVAEILQAAGKARF